jgi:hypothetical protein
LPECIGGSPHEDILKEDGPHVLYPQSSRGLRTEDVKTNFEMRIEDLRTDFGMRIEDVRT